jgi:hypothetical protein
MAAWKAAPRSLTVAAIYDDSKDIDGHTMSERLTKTFARFAEDAEFRRWNEERTLECRFVYVCQDSSVWKFTLEEWWKFVTKAIRNKGAYSLPSANTIQAPGKRIADVENGVSCDNTIRYVNLNCWTLSNWTDELQAI